MKVRILTAVVCIAFIIPFFWFSGARELTHPLSYLFPLLFCAICVVSVWEMLHCLHLDKTFAVSIPIYVAAAIFPMLARVLDILGRRALFIEIGALTALVLGLYLFAVMVFLFGKLDMGKLGLAFMTCFYIIGANSCVVLLRDMPHGKYLILIPFIFSWVTDSFAYFTGRLFGKHKLIEPVSPKKTVEGAIGGFVFCILAAVLYGLIVGLCFGETPNYLVLGICGLLSGVVSQIGDLILSAIKREQGIKDYGRVLPGHGGLLDRFDSSMAVTILVTVIARFLPLFA